MSKGARLGLIALAIAVAVGAFVVTSPGDDDDSSGTPAADTTEGQPTATAPSAPEPPPDGPDSLRIDLADHVPSGGAASIEVKKGERVRFVVTSDEPDQIHVHGYDVERKVVPGKPTLFSFPATIEGIFEVESHEAEHHGEDPLIARLVVEPS
jgi:hypothetical protein